MQCLIIYFHPFLILYKHTLLNMTAALSHLQANTVYPQSIAASYVSSSSQSVRPY